jgi:1-acyl-sn-glycerol-3-phosphate acyltransferase
LTFFTRTLLPNLRGLVFTVWMGALAVVIGLVCLPLLLGPQALMCRIMGLWAKGVLLGLRVICGVRVEIRGRENLPSEGVLIAAKHQGGLDIMAPFAVLREPCFVLKRELLSIPVFGWYAVRSGQIPIVREGGAKTMREMLRKVRTRFDEGRQIIIFPEGTRKAPGAEPDYKPGIAGMYKELGVPCTPVATNSGLCWPARGMAKYPGKVVFSILPPIPADLKRAEFMRALQTAIETESAALLAEAGFVPPT